MEPSCEGGILGTCPCPGTDCVRLWPATATAHRRAQQAEEKRPKGQHALERLPVALVAIDAEFQVLPQPLQTLHIHRIQLAHSLSQQPARWAGLHRAGPSNENAKDSMKSVETAPHALLTPGRRHGHVQGQRHQPRVQLCLIDSTRPRLKRRQCLVLATVAAVLALALALVLALAAASLAFIVLAASTASGGVVALAVRKHVSIRVALGPRFHLFG
mmetsp:Transcript_61712/g.156844  ORF Transcript_61712/g.156844 Transcript_61712/m.156844 type:complete len:216 (+) Transcript_61712:217-864(+)